jgi:hypothetical protein
MEYPGIKNFSIFTVNIARQRFAYAAVKLFCANLRPLPWTKVGSCFSELVHKIYLPEMGVKETQSKTERL